MTPMQIKILDYLELHPNTNAETIAQLLWQDTDTDIGDTAKQYHNNSFGFRTAKLRAGQYMGKLAAKGWVRVHWDISGCHDGYTISTEGKNELKRNK